MSISRYRAFVRAAELHSLTRAAEDLNYTQSNISHMIQALEKEYGFQLLGRNKAGVFLTENGSRLIDTMRGIIHLENKLAQMVDDIRGLRTGTLRIGSFSSVSTQWLPDAIVYFQDTYPEVEIRLLNGEYQEILDWLDEGKIDCGFITEAAVRGGPFLPLVQDEMMAVVSPRRQGQLVDCYPVEGFRQEPFIQPYQSHGDDVEHLFRQLNIRPQVRFTVKGDEAIVALVAKDLGVGLLPRLYLESAGDQVLALPLRPRQYRTIGLALSDRYEHLPLTHIFIQWIREWLEKRYSSQTWQE